MVTVADVMTANVKTISPETPVRDIARLLHTLRLSGAPVVDSAGNIVGIVTEGDLIRHTAAIGEQSEDPPSWWQTLLTSEGKMARDYAKRHGRTTKDVMTEKVITITETAPVADVARAMERHRIKRLPVVRDGKLVGIVSRSDLLKILAGHDTAEPEAVMTDAAIRERLLAQLANQPWAHLTTKNIEVENGTVRLFGSVQTEEERQGLCLAAQSVPGVVAVEDYLSPAIPLVV
jgi:CBS domain-containing protein